MRQEIVFGVDPIEDALVTQHVARELETGVLAIRVDLWCKGIDQLPCT